MLFHEKPTCFFTGVEKNYINDRFYKVKKLNCIKVICTYRVRDHICNYINVGALSYGTIFVVESFLRHNLQGFTQLSDGDTEQNMKTG